MVKKIRCKIDSNDWVSSDVSSTGKNVRVKMGVDGVCQTVLLTPSDARKLRKQIKKALEAIEGVDEEEVEEPKEEPSTKDPHFPDWFQKGKIVEITGNSNMHHFEIGEKVRVVGGMQCEDLDGRDYWFVLPGDCKPA